MEGALSVGLRIQAWLREGCEWGSSVRAVVSTASMLPLVSPPTLNPGCAQKYRCNSAVPALRESPLAAHSPLDSDLTECHEAKSAKWDKRSGDPVQSSLSATDIWGDR